MTKPGSNQLVLWPRHELTELPARTAPRRPRSGRRRAGRGENLRELSEGVHAGRSVCKAISARPAPPREHYIAIWLAIYA